jgi:hypothetical protein
MEGWASKPPLAGLPVAPRSTEDVPVRERDTWRLVEWISLPDIGSGVPEVRSEIP